MFYLYSNSGFFSGVELNSPKWAETIDEAIWFNSYRTAFNAMEEMTRDGMTWVDQLCIGQVKWKRLAPAANPTV